MDIAIARTAETRGQLSSRTGNTWSVAETAVANALAQDVRLRGPQPVKIAVGQPYRPRK